MRYIFRSKILFTIGLCLVCIISFGQNQSSKDSFFLAKKKGIFGKIGKSISKDPTPAPVKISNPFEQYKGKIIRDIYVAPLNFNVDINDTNSVKNDFATRVMDFFHATTRERIIEKYLFFHEGEKLLPLKLADNEKFLRDQSFLRDALIYVFPDETSDSVDVMVLTRDVFSIGGNMDISTKRVKAQLRERNLGGTGNQFSIGALYDKTRNPNWGFSGEYVKRNLFNRLWDWTTGVTTFNRGFNSGRYEEQSIYSRMEKPLFSRYSRWTGSAEGGIHRVRNNYLTDSLFNIDYRYTFLSLDGWIGYNIGSNANTLTDNEHRLRHLIAVRSLYNIFYRKPDKYANIYNYQYADVNGFLASYSLYRRNYYKTNFVYGFGINEDIPTGISANATYGYTNKSGYKRNYYGFEIENMNIGKKGGFNNYDLKLSGYNRGSLWEDIYLIAAFNRFSSLHKMSEKWRSRWFLNSSFSSQVKPFLNQPLFLNSQYGLPYYHQGLLEGDKRITAKFEFVAYHLRKFIGFRFAPFGFADWTLLRPINETWSKAKGYSGIGIGLRARNENLIFDTMEGRVWYNTNAFDGMKKIGVDFSTKVSFRYSKSFVNKPDFVIAN